MLVRVRRCPNNPSPPSISNLRNFLLQAYSVFKSCLTHSSQVCLPPSPPLEAITSYFLYAETKSFLFLRSLCLNHLSLPCHTTSATSCPLLSSARFHCHILEPSAHALYTPNLLLQRGASRCRDWRQLHKTHSSTSTSSPIVLNCFFSPPLAPIIAQLNHALHLFVQPIDIISLSPIPQLHSCHPRNF